MSGKRQSSGYLVGIAIAVVITAGYLLMRKPSNASKLAAAESARPATTDAPRGTSAPRKAPTASPAARKARDVMRDQIFEALRKRDAGAPPAPAANAPAAAKAAAPAAPAAADDRPPTTGRMDPQYIQRTFRQEMFPMLRQCYESALAQQPKLAGRLVLTFRIVADPDIGGVVEDADFDETSDLKDADMETCVRETLTTLTFDKPPTGGDVTVKYPIVFSPGDEDDAGAGAANRGAPDGGVSDGGAR